MILRRQLPVWSPITLASLWSGCRAAWLGAGGAAWREVDRSLRELYTPRELYLTDSGTSALTLALVVAQRNTGGPVALPAYCCYDVATAADGAGVPFLLYDLDPATLSPDPASLRGTLEAGARAIVVAHLYGVPVDMAAVEALAAEFGAIVVEDAAQGAGGEWKGRPAGAHGALGVLSFGRGKGVTGGKGGALLVNDERLLAEAGSAWETLAEAGKPRGSLRDFVLLVAQWLFGRPWLYWIPASLPFLGLGDTVYRRPHPIGALTTLAAGVLWKTLPLGPGEAAGRRAVAARLQGELREASLVTPPPLWTPGWLRFPIVRQRTADSADRGYSSSADGVVPGYPRSLADLEGFGGRRDNSAAEFPGARRLAERLVTLPTHRFVRRATDHAN